MSMMADRQAEGGEVAGRYDGWGCGWGVKVVMMDDGNEGYDEGGDEGGDEGSDKVEWLILRCRDVGLADMPDIWWGFCAI